MLLVFFDVAPVNESAVGPIGKELFEKEQEDLLADLKDIPAISMPGDFPDVEHFKQVLAGYSIDKFEKIKPKMVQAVDDMLAHDIPDLLKNFSNPYQ